MTPMGQCVIRWPYPWCWGKKNVVCCSKGQSRRRIGCAFSSRHIFMQQRFNRICLVSRSSSR
ncbi:mCG147005 [Mus musculus]|nr:mCG147005 [Mus musculus]